MGVIKVKDRDGKSHVLEAVEGWRVMEILRDHGMAIGGLCGGACACATCHVQVAPEWVARLHPAREEEEDILDAVPGATERSRLSCQIIWDSHLDGLEVQLTGGGAWRA